MESCIHFLWKYETSFLRIKDLHSSIKQGWYEYSLCFKVSMTCLRDIRLPVRWNYVGLDSFTSCFSTPVIEHALAGPFAIEILKIQQNIFHCWNGADFLLIHSKFLWKQAVQTYMNGFRKHALFQSCFYFFPSRSTGLSKPLGFAHPWCKAPLVVEVSHLKTWVPGVRSILGFRAFSKFIRFHMLWGIKSLKIRQT